LVLTARLDANWMVMDIHRQKYFGLFGRRCLSFRLAILRTLELSFISQSLLLEGAVGVAEGLPFDD
jgi:hypothetical protein